MKFFPLISAKFILLFLLVFTSFFSVSFAEQSKNTEISQNKEWNTGNIRIKHEYQHFILKNVGKYITIEEKKQKPEISGFCFEDDQKNIEHTIPVKGINIPAIEKYLSEKIAPEINQEVSHVKIFRDAESKKIQFEGYAYDGIELNIEESAQLIAFAIQNNIDKVTLSVKRIPAQVVVDDEELRKKGIKELVSVGRSDFYPSSRKRIQNIMAGAGRFNGYLIEPGQEFSFNTQLGLVDGTTGYAQEYVILGPKVVKEYGGGLCQVSSTAYRGVMLAGLEITERHNHSFAVSHYKPHGSDATIYQGVKDFRWINDIDTAILIQTRRGGKRNSELFFHYYGTKSNRDVKILGPLRRNFRNPLPAKTTYSDSMPVGTSRKVSGAVSGLDTYFSRIVTDKKSEKTLYDDTFFSHYQARGIWIIKGGKEKPAPSSSEISRPEFVKPN